jgi:hypothetical protein
MPYFSEPMKLGGIAGVGVDEVDRRVVEGHSP